MRAILVQNRFYYLALVIFYKFQLDRVCFQEKFGLRFGEKLQLALPGCLAVKLVALAA